ncbi:MAG: calcium/sodium antiporter [SAR202 cluster bacterium]|nr:calcium/sodium antiporter [SAR202 cluster bacterium]
MEPIHYLQLIGGLALLVAGAEALVRGASRLAALFGISPLIIGLTIVALGTSSPEIAVSVTAAVKGSTGVTLGNVIGSNIANVLLILGAAAVITPLLVAQRLVRLDVPIMIGISLVVVFLALDGQLGRIDGVVLVCGLLVYIAFQVKKAREEMPRVEKEYEKEFGLPRQHTGAQTALSVLGIAVGLTLMVFGSRWLVDGASAAARALGVGEFVIGITVVALGTSLPELVTSILAAIQRQKDIAVGNIIGSNIYNLLAVLGISSLSASGIGIEVSRQVLQFDLPVMVAVAVACLPIFFRNYRINRLEGFVFLGYYVAYITYLVLKATDSRAIPTFDFIMLAFVLPLTAFSLGIITWRSVWRSWKHSRVTTRRGPA